LAYIDDSFSHDTAIHLAYYAPYNDWFPPKQVLLLKLWDFIGLPHEKDKQEFGRTLVITGILVDPQAMTLTLPPESITELVAAIREFLSAPSRRRPLVEWWRKLGWMNWALNVAPLLRPALSSAYDKIAGLSVRNAPVFINARIKRDWSWFADTLEGWDGVHILRARNW
ncbi:hypothetical protein BV25DRAFT_1790637, partial [Artomyces pyxidatus]